MTDGDVSLQTMFAYFKRKLDHVPHQLEMILKRMAQVEDQQAHMAIVVAQYGRRQARGESEVSSNASVSQSEMSTPPAVQMHTHGQAPPGEGQGDIVVGDRDEASMSCTPQNVRFYSGILVRLLEKMSKNAKVRHSFK